MATNLRARRQFQVALIGGLLLGANHAVACAASQMQSTSLHVEASDMDATAKWYADFLGFRQVAARASGNERVLTLSRGATLLEVRAKGLSAGAGEAPQPELTIFVPDADREASRLQDKGVVVASPPQDEDSGKFRSALIRDLEGRLIQLREPLGTASP